MATKLVINSPFPQLPVGADQSNTGRDPGSVFPLLLLIHVINSEEFIIKSGRYTMFARIVNVSFLFCWEGVFIFCHKTHVVRDPVAGSLHVYLEKYFSKLDFLLSFYINYITFLFVIVLPMIVIRYISAAL